MSGCISPGCQLKNAQAFLDVIYKHENVKAVISGHTHCAKESSQSGIQFLTTPSTFLHASHPQEGGSEYAEDMMKSHSFSRDMRGYRVIDLFSNGDLMSEVCWVPIESKTHNQ